MAYYGKNGPYGDYVTKAEKQARAARAAKRLSKSRQLNPVRPAGNTLAITWWGKSWVKNLNGYADFSSRLPRGRDYVRSGAVIDLDIGPGAVTALVAGSHTKPYQVTVTIAPLKKKARDGLVALCRKSITGLPALLKGEFPKELERRFLARGDGLFPAPREIKFDCTCPDWARMCKHVAAALFGAAVRLDEQPELFFTLRGLYVEDFVGTVLKKEATDLLSRAAKKSSRIIPLKDARRLFGPE